MAKSVIPPGVVVTGNLRGGGDLEIRGAADTDIECRRLWLHQGARLAGRVTADQVTIGGHFVGEIDADEVNLLAAGTATGEIWSQRLEVEAGSHLDAYCSRRKPPAPTVGTVVPIAPHRRNTDDAC